MNNCNVVYSGKDYGIQISLLIEEGRIKLDAASKSKQVYLLYVQLNSCLVRGKN